MIRENTFTGSGSAGAPTLTRVPSRAQQLQVGVDVDPGADRVDDQVEGAGEVGEGVCVARGVVVVGAQAQPVFLLLQRLRQHGDLGAHGVGDLDGHVAEAAQADDRDLLAGAGAPVPFSGE